MKLFPISLALIFLALSVQAQKNETPLRETNAYDGTFAKIHYWDYKLSSAADTLAIKSILKRELNLGENDAFVVMHIASSLTATHITLKQLYKGNEVYGGGAKVAISKNNVLFRCIETVFPTQGLIGNLPLLVGQEQLLSQFSQINFLENKAVYLWDGNRLVPGWYASFSHGQNGFNDAAWFANGDPYFLRDRLEYAGDSTVSMKVFNPDPITPINKIYGGIYIDNNDNNEAVLNPLRETVLAKVSFENDTFWLKSDYVELVEADWPVNPVANAVIPEFEFSRTDFEFEQVNAYYHISTYQNYLQSLGYSLVQYPIRVDAQGWGGQDNSSFNASSQPRPLLSFGEGGVDDAEDADVVVHEYGHAISNSASPSTNQGNERRTLDEAVGDYFAVSYKKTEHSFGSDKVFNWDGHNTFWQGRTVNNPSNFNYKTITTFNAPYTYTTLWNDAMFDIWNQLGKAYTDKLQIEALYGYMSNMSFRQAALLVLDADTALTGGGNNSLVIWQAFDARGILEWSDVKEFKKDAKPFSVKNTICSALNPAIIVMHEAGYTALITDLNGKMISSQIMEIGENALRLEGCQSGMYLVQLENDRMLYTEKIIVNK